MSSSRAISSRSRPACTIRAIRNADSLVFFHNVEYAGERGPWLKAIRDGERSSTGFEEQHWVRLAEARVANYEEGMGESRPDFPNKGRATDQLIGSVVLLSVSVRPEIATWTKILREGDALVVEFLVGNNNETLRKAGLSHDEAWLGVYRDKADRKMAQVGRYFLDDTIAPVWSSARMVRPL